MILWRHFELIKDVSPLDLGKEDKSLFVLSQSVVLQVFGNPRKEMQHKSASSNVCLHGQSFQEEGKRPLNFSIFCGCSSVTHCVLVFVQNSFVLNCFSCIWFVLQWNTKITLEKNILCTKWLLRQCKGGKYPTFQFCFCFLLLNQPNSFPLVCEKYCLAHDHYLNLKKRTTQKQQQLGCQSVVPFDKEITGTGSDANVNVGTQVVVFLLLNLPWTLMSRQQRIFLTHSKRTCPALCWFAVWCCLDCWHSLIICQQQQNKSNVSLVGFSRVKEKKGVKIRFVYFPITNRKKILGFESGSIEWHDSFKAGMSKAAAE